MLVPRTQGLREAPWLAVGRIAGGEWGALAQLLEPPSITAAS